MTILEVKLPFFGNCGVLKPINLVTEDEIVLFLLAGIDNWYMNHSHFSILLT